MTIPQWSPSEIYNPGDIVLPRSQNVVTNQQPNNNSFDTAGLTHWATTFEAGASGTVSAAVDRAFDGADSAKFTAGAGTQLRTSGVMVLINDLAAAVTPGKTINFQCYINRSNVNTATAGVADGGPRIYWYDAASAFISFSPASVYPGAVPGPAPGGTPTGFVGGSAPFDQWLAVKGSAVAPPGAAFAKAAIAFRTNNTGGAVWGDLFTWDYTFQGLAPGLVFVAVQAGVGTSGAQEPVWPVTNGSTVTDNTVIWQAEFASRITWTASPILKSGAAEPAWKLDIGAAVTDAVGTNHAISWVAFDGRVTDPNCPQSKIVAIAQSKVFAADKDTIPFSATTNPLDWSTANDAGYLPFGLQTYGSEPCAAMGLYRSNLVALNSLGYQMWQIDPDPANMALLDSEPVGSTFNKSLAPVQNDLVFLTTKGIRSIGVTGQTGNLQAGQFGKNIDPLVIASIAGGLTPRGLFYPGTGQYWLCFGSAIYTMTNNGGGANSWSRYALPGPVDAWTIENGVLLIRSGNFIWQIDENTTSDDADAGLGQGGTNTLFSGIIQWPFLDLGPLGVDKDLEGVDIICTGSGTIAVLYDQTNLAITTPPIAFTGDTMPSVGMIPIPALSPSFGFKLTFDTNQIWEWEALTVHSSVTGEK